MDLVRTPDEPSEAATTAGPTVLTDEQIAALTPGQRRDLVLRLARPAADVLPRPHVVRRIRWVRIALTVAGALLLVPWTIYLATTLPSRYLAHNWDLVWVGYDLLLLVMLGITGWLTWRRRQVVILTSFATGVLVLADAWFDVLTARPRDLWLSAVVAVVIELPVALGLMASSVRLMRLTAARFWLMTPGMRFWQIPLAVVEGVDPDTLQPVRNDPSP